MLVQVNTDNHVAGTAALRDWVKSEMEGSFSRFEPQLMRLEVYLSDLNSHKEGKADKQCTLEARLAGLDPIAVTKNAATVEAALDAAEEALLLALDSRLGRLADRRGRVPMGGEPGV